MAAGAHHRPCCAVQFEHLAGRAAGALMQPGSPAAFCVITRTAPAARSSSATARCAAFGSARNVGLLARICQERRRISGSLMYASYVTSFSAPGSRRHRPLGPR